MVIRIKYFYGSTLIEGMYYVVSNKLHNQKNDSTIRDGITNLLRCLLIYKRVNYGARKNKFIMFGREYSLPRYIISVLHVDEIPVSVIFINSFNMSIYTDPKYRKQGYLKALYKAVLEKFPEIITCVPNYSQDKKTINIFNKLGVIFETTNSAYCEYETTGLPCRTKINRFKINKYLLENCN